MLRIMGKPQWRNWPFDGRFIRSEIITNSDGHIQHRRIASSGLLDHVSFVATSKECGVGKPDIRIFEYAAKMAKPIQKHESIIMGDRLDADILGAKRDGIESCWFNPARRINNSAAMPTYEVATLHELSPMLDGLKVI